MNGLKIKKINEQNIAARLKIIRDQIWALSKEDESAERFILWGELKVAVGRVYDNLEKNL